VIGASPLFGMLIYHSLISSWAIRRLVGLASPMTIPTSETLGALASHGFLLVMTARGLMCAWSNTGHASGDNSNSGEGKGKKASKKVN